MPRPPRGAAEGGLKDLLIKDKVAVVTGGAKGLGAGVTEALADEGCRVAVVYRSDREGSEAACAAIAA